MSDDPWKSLSPPIEADSINARRVDETSPWDFYWALDSNHYCLLVLRHGSSSSPRDRLPHLKGVDVLLAPPKDGHKPSLVVRLLDSTLRDIFHRLCLDIVGSTSRVEGEAAAVSTAVARLWRWHHLLRGGTGGRLSVQEQMGLIGELLVLERYLLGSVPAREAIAAWRGPLGAAQDFVIGRTAIESKARATGDASRVPISSEYQLDTSNFANLFLHISVLDNAEHHGDDGFSLTDVVTRIQASILTSEEGLAEQFDALLMAAGFRPEDDYSTLRWTGGERSIYRVEGGFPRLMTATIPGGVANVKYTLSLPECAGFLALPAALQAAIVGDQRVS